jgi:hypothetical protein
MIADVNCTKSCERPGELDAFGHGRRSRMVLQARGFDRQVNDRQMAVVVAPAVDLFQARDDRYVPLMKGWLNHPPPGNDRSLRGSSAVPMSIHRPNSFFYQRPAIGCQDAFAIRRESQEKGFSN